MSTVSGTDRSAVWPMRLILAGFWAYVTISNILYAHSMNASFAKSTTEHLFAPWDQRLLQHLFLYPALVLSLSVSLKIRWSPLALALPLQLVIAVTFAALGAPALFVSEMLLGSHEWDAGSGATGFVHWFSSSDGSLWLASGTNMFLAYGFALALATGFTLYRRFRDAELHVSALQREFGVARLSALRMQLSPHTLFNLLHTIHGQIGWDPRAAQVMVIQLGDLLRSLLKVSEQEFSRLGDEMQFVLLYLGLQEKRFADRLSVTLPAHDTLPVAWVPSLILQPLVENAVVHGLAGHEGPLRVTVSASTVGEELILRVTNSIAPGHTVNAAGIGTRNVRERLTVHFGERAQFVSVATATGVWLAEVRMPWLRDGPQ